MFMIVVLAPAAYAAGFDFAMDEFSIDGNYLSFGNRDGFINFSDDFEDGLTGWNVNTFFLCIRSACYEEDGYFQLRESDEYNVANHFGFTFIEDFSYLLLPTSTPDIYDALMDGRGDSVITATFRPDVPTGTEFYGFGIINGGSGFVESTAIIVKQFRVGFGPIMVSVNDHTGTVLAGNIIDLSGAQSVTLRLEVDDTTNTVRASYRIDGGAYKDATTWNNYVRDGTIFQNSQNINWAFPFIHAGRIATREVCDDGIDNNGNGKTDCEDAICGSAAVCQAPPEPEGPSHVLFVPGLYGSKIFTAEKRVVFGGYHNEDRIWPPNNCGDYVNLTASNTTFNPIYTRTREETREDGLMSAVIGRNIYKTFIKDLNSGFGNDPEFNDFEWRAVPYDWRMRDQFEYRDLTVSGEVLSDDIPGFGINLRTNYISDMLIALSEKPGGTGKVTIIAHSTGGLLVKRLIQNGQLDPGLIDKIIFVAVPHSGAPKTYGALLHGIGVPLADPGGIDFYCKEEEQYKIRNVARDLLVSYFLSPTRRYFMPSFSENRSGSNTVFDLSWDLGSTVSEVELFRSIGSRFTYSSVKDFITVESGLRAEDEQDLMGVLSVDELSRWYMEEEQEKFAEWNPNGIETYAIVGTNVDTPYGIKYTARRVFSDRHVGWIKYRYGDGTVPEHSAADVDASETYFIDLGLWNRENSPTGLTDREHGSILEPEPVRQQIRNLLLGETTVANSIYMDFEPQTPDSTERIEVVVFSPVTLAITDSFGNRTGIIEEIDSETLRTEEGVPSSSFELLPGGHQSISFRNAEGIQIEGVGFETGTFSIEVTKYVDDEMVEEVTFVQVPTVEGLTFVVDTTTGVADATLVIDEDGDGETDFEILAGEEPSNLQYKEAIALALAGLRVSADASGTSSRLRSWLGKFVWRIERHIAKYDRLESRGKGRGKASRAHLKKAERKLEKFEYMLSLFSRWSLIEENIAEELSSESVRIIELIQILRGKIGSS